MSDQDRTPHYLLHRLYSYGRQLPRYMCLMAVFLCCIPLMEGAFAQLRSGDHFIEVTDEYQPVGSVYDLLQDEAGAIWSATENGLYYYDGNVLAGVLELDPRATWLDRVAIHELMIDSQGRVWIIYQDGIAFWDEESRSFLPLTQIAGKRGTAILEQAKDHYWIGTEDGLYYLDATSATDPNLERLVFVNEHENGGNLNFITTLYLDQNEVLWVGTSEGLCVLNTKTRQIKEIMVPDASEPLPYVSFIEEDASGQVWFGTRENGLVRVGKQATSDEQVEADVKFFTALPSRQLLSVQQNREGTFFIGTANNGFFLWDPIREAVADLSLYHVGNEDETSMAGARVLSLLLDKTGLLWLGTSSGIYRSVYRPVFTSYNLLHESLAARNIKHVKSLVQDPRGHLWVGSFGEGVVHVDEQSGEVVHFKNQPGEPNSLIDDRVLAIDVDKQLNVWILTSGGISRFDLTTDTFSSYLVSDAVSIVDENIIFQDIFVSASNEVWVTTSFNGLLKFDSHENQFKPWPLLVEGANDYSLLEIRQIIEDQDGMLWFAAGKGGLLKYDVYNQSFVDIVVGEENVLKGMEVVSLTQTKNGDIWAGTQRAGVFKIPGDGSGYAQYTRQEGLPGNEVTCIIEDRNGYIWISVRDGVARYDPELDTLLKYDEHDGLRSTQFYYNSCLLSENRVLLGNNLGVEVLNLDDVSEPEPRPIIQLASVQVLNTPLYPKDMSQPIQLERDNNYIRFQFFIPDYLNPSQNQLKYKLSGRDMQWKVAGADHVLAFSDLDPGRYRLFVKGANHRGVWSEPHIYTIEVSSMRWYLLGGIGITGLLFIGGLGGAWSFRNKYLVRIKELEAENLSLQDESQQSVERTKAEIARDLHDDLGADLSRLVLSLENRLQRDDLSDFSLAWTQECWQYAQRVTREVRFLSWSVDPDRNWLPDLVDRIYREAHDTFDVDKIQFLTSKIPHIHLAPKVRKDIFLIFRESLTNILHHASAQKIRIQVSYKKRMLEIIIEDDGIGFDVEKVVEGNGLSNMRKRARNLNANLFWDSKAGRGTRVVFQLLVE